MSFFEVSFTGDSALHVFLDAARPGAVSMCNGKCQMSSCRACYYSKVKREVPQTTVTCPTYPGSKCSRQWVTQVRRENFRIHGKVAI